jgi:hypothetical protein
MAAVAWSAWNDFAVFAVAKTMAKSAGVLEYLKGRLVYDKVW